MLAFLSLNLFSTVPYQHYNAIINNNLFAAVQPLNIAASMHGTLVHFRLYVTLHVL